jgi:2-aminoethylphosphonate-pyruvate transaminase
LRRVKRVIKQVREGVLRVAGVSAEEFTMIPMQGSGTYGVESVLTSVVPQGGKGSLLILANGAYGLRMENMAKVHKMRYEILRYPDDVATKVEDLELALQKHPEVTHVAMVHSETTSGLVNDIHAAGAVAKKHGKSFIVDAMSSFGGIPIDMNRAAIDYLVTCSNKCVQGSPGFAIVVARKSALQATQGNARTLSLNIHDQAKGLDANGQFRFTPPTHSLLAFQQALKELEEEGGVNGRFRRYYGNQQVVHKVLTDLGFKPYLDAKIQGPILSTFRSPKDPKWNFDVFYRKLNERGLVIYPGKVANADSFRIGHIGQINEDDSRRLVEEIGKIVKEMGFSPAA